MIELLRALEQEMRKKAYEQRQEGQISGPLYLVNIADRLSAILRNHSSDKPIDKAHKALDRAIAAVSKPTGG